MHKSTRHVGLSLAAAAILATTVTAEATGSAETPTPRHQRSTVERLVFETPWSSGKSTYIDLGSKGLGPGDIFLSTRQTMLAHGERVGTMEGVETILSGAHDGIVSQQITLRLAGGRVMIDGIGRHDDQPFQLAVVGGTGKYKTARGQFVVLGEDEQRKVSITKLVLTR